MSLSRTGWPTVLTRSRNSSSLPGLIVYPYQKVSGCIWGCDCCAALEIQDNRTRKRHKIRRVFIVQSLREILLACIWANNRLLVKKLRRCEQALNVVTSKGPTFWRMGYLVASRIDYVKEFATSSPLTLRIR